METFELELNHLATKYKLKYDREKKPVSSILSMRNNIDLLKSIFEGYNKDAIILFNNVGDKLPKAQKLELKELLEKEAKKFINECYNS